MRRASVWSRVTMPTVLLARHRLPRGQRHGARFQIGVRRGDHADAGERRVELRIDPGPSRAPLRGLVGERQRMSHDAGARRLARQLFDIGDPGAEPAQQARQYELRMPLGVGAVEQHLVLPRRQRRVEPGQHHGAARQRRDGLQQRGGCRQRAGRARRQSPAARHTAPAPCSPAARAARCGRWTGRSCRARRESSATPRAPARGRPAHPANCRRGRRPAVDRAASGRRLRSQDRRSAARANRPATAARRRWAARHSPPPTAQTV